jgi:hypothetical protein
MAAMRAGCSVSEHHVRELVVAVDDAGTVRARLVRPQPRRRVVDAGQLAELARREVREPAVHLALVETLGLAEPLEAARSPVDAREPRDCVDELEREALPCVEVGVERRGPAVRAHAGPAVDELHQVEGRADHVDVVAGGEDAAVRHVRILSAASTRYSRSIVSFRPFGTLRGGRRSAMRASPRRISKSSFDAPPVTKRASSGRPLPGSFCASIQRARASRIDQPLDAIRVVAGHQRFPASWSRYSRESRAGGGDAVGQEFGRPQAGRGLVLRQHRLRDRDFVHLRRPVGDAHHGAVNQRPMSGISFEQPSAPWTCSERRTTSCRTSVIATFTARCTSGVLLPPLVDQPRV